MKHLSLLFLLLATTIATCHGSEPSIRHQIHLLRPQTGSSGHPHSGLSCLSWRLGVETNNIINWTSAPKECESYVGHYMLGHQYRFDSRTVVDQAFTYAQSFNLTGINKPIWVFDVDETSLSNLPYFAKHGFGSEALNNTAAQEWISEGRVPAMPETLWLYKKLLPLGIKIVFLTGRSEVIRSVTAANLKNVGFHTWEKLIVRDSTETGTTAVYFKSGKRTELVKQGYEIIGNMGDQWSDLLGANPGHRSFKLPNPVYYVA